MRAIIFLLLASVAVSASASEPKVPDALKRKIVVPSIVALTDCVARYVLLSLDERKDAEVNDLLGDVRTALPKCESYRKPMIATYDIVYGPGEGQKFFDGPYMADIERALDARISDPTFPRAPKPIEKTVYVNVPGPVQEKIIERVKDCPAPIASPAPQAQAASQSMPVAIVAGPAQNLSVSDLPAMHETYKKNEARFMRDYGGKNFAATMPIHSIGRELLSDEGYSVTFGSSMFSDVDCHVADKATIDMISNMNKGDNIIVSGIVEDHSFGAVVLKQCELKRP